MDAVDQISKLFDQLLARGYQRVFDWPFAEQIVFLVVCARCEKDIGGFNSIFEQVYEPRELKALIDGLHKMGESPMACEFTSALKLLEQEGFFLHRSFELVSPAVEEEIAQIGNRVGDGLWGLDEKLVALLEKEASESSRDRQA